MYRRHECDTCGLDVTALTGVSLEVYNTPWDDVPETIWVHTNENITRAAIRKQYGFDARGDTCVNLLFEHGFADFRYFECGHCYRLICEQNPSNGWHVQYRAYECEQICLHCYEEMILENGHDREAFEHGIPGMFFNHGNYEVTDAGFELVEGFDYYHVGNSDRVCSKALELIDSGHAVVIAYESMAIGGLEGTISMYCKEV